MKFTETLWLCRAADEARSCEANKFKHVDRLECTPLSGMVYCWQEWANLMRAARGRFSISPHHCGVPYQKRPSQVINQPKLVSETVERGDDTASAACTSILYRVCYEAPPPPLPP